MPGLTAAGLRALEILGAAPGSTLYGFAAAYWSEVEAVMRLGQAEKILQALVDAGLVSKSVNFGRHGPLYTLTSAGGAVIDTAQAQKNG